MKDTAKETELSKIVETLHPLERKVLPFLSQASSLNELMKKTSLKDVEVMRALQWLENKKVLVISTLLDEVIVLDKNGIKYKKNGLPERRFLKVLKEKSKTIEQLKNETKLNQEEFSISIGVLKKKGLIKLGKEVELTDLGKKAFNELTLEEKFIHQLPLNIKELKPEQKYALEELKKRKEIVNIELVKEKKFELTELGKRLAKIKVHNTTLEQLTPTILNSGAWKGKTFRRYDVSINVPTIFGGRKHFVNQAVDSIKKVWLNLGFKEMSGDFVQTSFWNLDALFVPQDHPARTMQDTFFVKNPKLGKLPDKKIVEAVKRVHENGGDTGSKGWNYKWDENIAKLNVLRTHTTTLSVKTIANLDKNKLPLKFFSIGRVFRNEALDWKHLFEFVQVEGIVVDRNANFRNLLGYLKEYYYKIGFDKIRFRPSYFPYTKFSLEVEVFDEKRKEWVELGGAGIFRPEVIKPLLGEDIPVLAWGQGMERSILRYYNLDDLRELYKNDLALTKKAKEWM
ncbi:phenylalanine--tRNA ligase subunit alpha [Candidatus Woesearchaeota archaeon]|nr:phenylalanine--tRNA ligase subunit alpha [Candidatus Woesearchaeota archaeon]